MTERGVFKKGVGLKTESYKNNFDFIRVFAAGLVLFSHQFALLGIAEPVLIRQVGFGSLGVCIFFSISGFLISQSWERDPNAARFIARRFLRIWPALFVVTALSVLVLEPLTSSHSLMNYLSLSETWNYFKTLLLLIKYKLPGVFASNPYAHAVNGSLWTIPLEVKWYWLVLLASIFKLLNFRYLVLIVLSGLGVFCFGIDEIEVNPKTNYFYEYGMFFLSGLCLHLFQDVWKKQSFRTMLCIGATAIAAYAFGHPLLGLLIVVPYAVIRLGLASTPVLRRFGRFGDCSYGLYIYAFPVQQLIVWWTDASLAVSASLVLSAAGTAALAFLSWHLVENPAMQLRPRQRGASDRTREIGIEVPTVRSL